ncbi:hypothetical protein FKM82_029455 [Ascaphus truei]
MALPAPAFPRAAENPLLPPHDQPRTHYRLMSRRAPVSCPPPSEPPPNAPVSSYLGGSWRAGSNRRYQRWGGGSDRPPICLHGGESQERGGKDPE